MEAITNSSSTVRSVFYCPHDPSLLWNLNNEDTIPRLVLAAIANIASPTTILLNTLVILAMSKRKELQKLSYVLLSSLAVVDLLVGALTMPLSATVDLLIVQQLSYPHICTLRLAAESSMFFLVWSSLYHLTVIAWERYMAVRRGIDYQVIVRKSLVKKLAIVAWLLAAFTSFPPLIMIVIGANHKIKELWHVGESVCSAFCLTVIAVFYVMVYLGVRERKINEISHVSSLTQAKLATKVAQTTGLLTIAAIVSFVPMCVGYILSQVFEVLSVWKILILRFSETAIQLNSLVNPVIYCYRDGRFRNALLELLRIRKPQPIRPPVGAARLVRREDPLDHLKNDHELKTECKTARLTRSASYDHAIIMGCELKTDGKSALLTRTASCDYVIGLDCVQRPHRKTLKRNLSAPSLGKDRSPYASSQEYEPSCFLVPTAAVLDGTGLQCKARKREEERKMREKREFSSFHNKSRSKSWDSMITVDFVRHRQKLKEKTLPRPKTAPCFPTNVIVPVETSTTD